MFALFSWFVLIGKFVQIIEIFLICQSSKWQGYYSKFQDLRKFALFSFSFIKNGNLFPPPFFVYRFSYLSESFFPRSSIFISNTIHICQNSDTKGFTVFRQHKLHPNKSQFILHINYNRFNRYCLSEQTTFSFDLNLSTILQTDQQQLFIHSHKEKKYSNNWI